MVSNHIFFLSICIQFVRVDAAGAYWMANNEMAQTIIGGVCFMRLVHGSNESLIRINVRIDKRTNRMNCHVQFPWSHGFYSRCANFTLPHIWHLTHHRSHGLSRTIIPDESRIEAFIQMLRHAISCSTDIHSHLTVSFSWTQVIRSCIANAATARAANTYDGYKCESNKLLLKVFMFFPPVWSNTTWSMCWSRLFVSLCLSPPFCFGACLLLSVSWTCAHTALKQCGTECVAVDALKIILQYSGIQNRWGND